MMMPNNPFLIAGYAGPDYFCDRENETRKIIDAFHNGRNQTIIAPRRMGKTGLIMHALYHMGQENRDIRTFYMDIYPTRNLGDFVRLFASTILGQLDSTPQKILTLASKVLRNCRPSISFDDLTGNPKITIDIADNEEESTLKDIFSYLKSSEKRCCIAIDEFQQINEYPESGVEALLRSYIQFVPNVNFIFAGSRKHVMQEMFVSAKRPFYQSTQLLSIEAIDKVKYCDFSKALFSNAELELPKHVFDFVYDRFDGHTWYIQYVMNRLWGYRHNADIPLAVNAMNEIIAEQGYAYADLMKAYPAGSVKLMKAIAREGKINEILSGSFISKYRLNAASSVSSALKKLIANEIVYKSDDGYMIYDRFMAEWLQAQAF